MGRKRTFIDSDPEAPGHRSSARYKVELDVRCIVLGTGHVVFGRIRDISSSGVFFACVETLPTGTQVELCVDWPVSLGDACDLQLKLLGFVVRTDGRGMAVSVLRYEFQPREVPKAT